MGPRNHNHTKRGKKGTADPFAQKTFLRNRTVLAAKLKTQKGSENTCKEGKQKVSIKLLKMLGTVLIRLEIKL